jgi:hypothetical protein
VLQETSKKALDLHQEEWKNPNVLPKYSKNGVQ